MKKLFFYGLIGLILIIPSLAYGDGPYLNIPPPNTYWHYQTQNGTSSAQNPYDTLKLQGLNGIQVLNVGNGTLLFNATLSSGNSTFTPLICALNSQLHSVDSSGVFTCAPNNSTGSNPTLDTMKNLTPSQASIYAGNSSNVLFNFKGLNFRSEERRVGKEGRFRS